VATLLLKSRISRSSATLGWKAAHQVDTSHKCSTVSLINPKCRSIHCRSSSRSNFRCHFWRNQNRVNFLSLNAAMFSQQCLDRWFVHRRIITRTRWTCFDFQPPHLPLIQFFDQILAQTGSDSVVSHALLFLGLAGLWLLGTSCMLSWSDCIDTWK